MSNALSFGWLLLGGVLLLFGFGRWMVPLAAWLAPVFLLHFMRTGSPVIGVLCVWLALFVAFAVSNRGVVPAPGAAYFGIASLYAVAMSLPYLADRLLAPPLAGLPSALVFPVAWTTAEFCMARVNPFGSWGALAYTQYGNLPLMQFASVAGIWGIGFLITWFAATVNWAWDRQFDWATVQSGVALYSVVWCSVILTGGARLAFTRRATTIRIAGVGWPPGIIELKEAMRLFEPDCTASERSQLRETFLRVQESFFECSQHEARAGARIIVWPEANLMVFKENERSVLERARQLARENEIWLLIGMATLDLGASRPVENKAVLLNGEGETVYTYTKITAVPGFEASTNVRGKGPIPVAETMYGRIVSPICFDLDFPGLIRQVGRARADLMLVPASDWKAITHLHELMAEFRAVENGVAMFRITRWGGSGAVDSYGRRLATMNDFAAQDHVMVAQVPAAAGVQTVYARTGDLFAWSCVVGMLVLVGWVVFLA